MLRPAVPQLAALSSTHGALATQTQSFFLINGAPESRFGGDALMTEGASIHLVPSDDTCAYPLTPAAVPSTSSNSWREGV